MNHYPVSIPAGNPLTLIEGEYSDTIYHGPFRVVKDIDKVAVLAAFRAQWTPSDEYEDGPEPHDFMAYLAREGFIVDDESVSWYIGAYGRLEECSI